MLTPNKEMLGVNEVLEIDDIGDKSDSEDPFNYNITAKSITEENVQI